MFPSRYFANRYWPVTYWPPIGAESTVTVIITPMSGNLIDDAATHTLSTKLDSVRIFCDGNNWWILSDK